MKERNTHFEKKYQKAQKLNNFFGYVVNSGPKSSMDLAQRRELYLMNIQRLSMPSSFTLEKTYQIQGPIVDIISGSNLNFIKLVYLNKLTVLGLKTNNTIYSRRTLEETVGYKNSNNLCFSLNADWHTKVIDLPQLLNFRLKSN